MQRVLNLILMVAITVVGWRVYTTWSVTPFVTQDAPPSRPTAPDLPSTARTPPPASLVSKIADRDLFDESRRSPSGAQVVDEEPVLPPDVELVGVLIAGSEPEALIRETGSGKGKNLRHVYSGDDVGGYTVSSITATEVKLTSPGGDEVSLPLSLDLGRGKARGGRKAASSSKDKTKKAQAAAAKIRAAGAAASGVRERLRELRRKRREANKARRPGAD